jgi:hypothetical protein
MEWKLIDTAPFDRDLELAVIDNKGTHAVAFPCRRLTDSDWIDFETDNPVYFHTPAHALARLVASLNIPRF